MENENKKELKREEIEQKMREVSKLIAQYADLQKELNELPIEAKEEYVEKYEKLQEELFKPIVVKDEQIKMGKQELDIRKLQKQNYNQLIFRQGVTACALLNDISQTMLDILRVNLIIADKLGVDNIAESLNKVIEKQLNQK